LDGGLKMKVSEAIIIQREFIANKYHTSRNIPDYKLKESMKTLTKAYDELWEFLNETYPDILDEFINSLEE
jgi:hypothetical protein